MAIKSTSQQASAPKSSKTLSETTASDSGKPRKASEAPLKTESTSTVKSRKAALTPVAHSDQPAEIETIQSTTPGSVESVQAVAAAASPAELKEAVPGSPKDKKWLEIRLILEKIKEDTLTEIRKAVKKGTEAVAAIEPGGDIYDQASSERDRELGLLLGDREREKIHSIDEALLRIDDGDYGICEECDEEIPLGRLKAMPFARHCVKCKTDIERLQAQTKRVEEERAYREIPMGGEEEEG
ncbi:MAG TPA: hypothetical protein HPP94_07085 [Desulfuromonadales bacterium]|nr:hypothetical protein [Desulfuromonadales bacterium]